MSSSPSPAKTHSSFHPPMLTPRPKTNPNTPRPLAFSRTYSTFSANQNNNNNNNDTKNDLSRQDSMMSTASSPNASSRRKQRLQKLLERTQTDFLNDLDKRRKKRKKTKNLLNNNDENAFFKNVRQLTHTTKLFSEKVHQVSFGKMITMMIIITTRLQIFRLLRLLRRLIDINNYHQSIMKTSKLQKQERRTSSKMVPKSLSKFTKTTSSRPPRS